MKKWIRLVFEIVLGASLAGAGTYVYLQTKEIEDLELKLTNSLAKKITRPTGKVGVSNDRINELLGKEKELDAVKSALSNGLALSDVEAAAKSSKNESAERFLALGALRLLVKGKNDPATAEAFEKALEMNQWTKRLKSVCAAQAGMVASGLKVDVLKDCDRIEELEASMMPKNKEQQQDTLENEVNSSENNGALGSAGV